MRITCRAVAGGCKRAHADDISSLLIIHRLTPRPVPHAHQQIVRWYIEQLWYDMAYFMMFI